MLRVQSLEPHQEKLSQNQSFYCGKRGHTKKNCFKRDLHQALKQLGPLPHQPTKKKQTSLDRMKEIEFIKKGDEIMMKHLEQELEMYIGKYKFEWAERYFRKPILPKMENGESHPRGSANDKTKDIKYPPSSVL